MLKFLTGLGFAMCVAGLLIYPRPTLFVVILLLVFASVMNEPKTDDAPTTDEPEQKPP